MHLLIMLSVATDPNVGTYKPKLQINMRIKLVSRDPHTKRTNYESLGNKRNYSWGGQIGIYLTPWSPERCCLGLR